MESFFARFADQSANIDGMRGASEPDEDGFDNLELLDFCYLCARQFFQEPHSDFQNEYAKERDENVLEMFLGRSGAEEQLFLQNSCCPTCSSLCKTLLRTKIALLSLVDEIRNLLHQSKRFSYLVSKGRVISRMFSPELACLFGNSIEEESEESNLTKQLNSENSISNVSGTFESHFMLSIDDHNMVDNYRNETRPTEGNKYRLARTSFEKTDFGNDKIFKQFEFSSSQPAAKTSENIIEGNFRLPNTIPSTFKLAVGKQDGGSLSKSLLDTLTPNRNNLNDSSPSASCNVEARKNDQIQQEDSLKDTILVSHEEVDQVNSKTYPSAGKKSFVCEKCGSHLKTRKSLKCHLKRHLGLSTFQCKECNKVFSQKIGLLRHMPIHTNVKAYQCDLCSKKFLYHTSFNSHKLTHSGIKEFQCTFENCSAAFNSKSHLQRHMKSHSGIRPYQCQLCPRKFTERYNLESHQSKVHSAEEPSQCSRCEKSFSTKRKLTRHYMIKHVDVS